MVVFLIATVLETFLEPQVWMGKHLGEAKVTGTLPDLGGYTSLFSACVHLWWECPSAPKAAAVF